MIAGTRATPIAIGKPKGEMVIVSRLEADRATIRAKLLLVSAS